MAIRNYKDLEVWKYAMELADIAFSISEMLPPHQRYVLCSQIERSATSVVANIAEGRSRHSSKDFIYHLDIARGSLAELETLLLLANRRYAIAANSLEDAFVLSEKVTQMLHGLKSSLQKPKTQNPKPLSIEAAL